MDKKTCVVNIIKNHCSTEEIVDIWHNVCDANNDMDNDVYSNDEYFFNDIFQTPYDAVRAVVFGEYRYNDTYVRFNGYANLESFNYWDDDNSPIDADLIADYLIENGDSEMPIDSDYFLDGFADYVVEKYGGDKCSIVYKVEDYLKEEDADFLMDDWDDIYENIFEE